LILSDLEEQVGDMQLVCLVVGFLEQGKDEHYQTKYHSLSQLMNVVVVAAAVVVRSFHLVVGVGVHSYRLVVTVVEVHSCHLEVEVVVHSYRLVVPVGEVHSFHVVVVVVVQSYHLVHCYIFEHELNQVHKNRKGALNSYHLRLMRAEIVNVIFSFL